MGKHAFSRRRGKEKETPISLAPTKAPGASVDWFNRVFIWRAALVAAIGGLLFGYDWVVIGGASPFYQLYFHLHAKSDAWAIGWAMGCAVMGGIIGATVAGPLSDKFGRKRLLFAAAGLFCLTSIGTGAADAFHTFVLWRILGGVAIGMASNLSPVYIAEIAPAAIRGKLVAANQLAIAFGVVAAQAVNWLIAQPVAAHLTHAQLMQTWNVRFGWRWMFIATACPAFLFLLGVFTVPESPRWLLKTGKLAEAKKILTRIGGAAYATASIDSVNAGLAEEGNLKPLAELIHPKMRPVLTLGIVLAVFQQWCGINVIFNYGPTIFKSAGYKINGALFNIVLTGVAAFFAALLAMAIVDHVGRRIMMLAGALGLAATYFVLALSIHNHAVGLPVVILVVAAVGIYSATLAPVTWVVLSEIFPTRVRGAAMSVSTFALWTACFILTFTFPSIKAHLGLAGTFALYDVICLLGAVFIFLRLAETKGRTLEQIEHGFLGE